MSEDLASGFLDSWRGGDMHLPMGAKFGSVQIGQPCFIEL